MTSNIFFPVNAEITPTDKNKQLTIIKPTPTDINRSD